MASNLQGSAADSDVRVRQLEAKLAGTVKHTHIIQIHKSSREELHFNQSLPHFGVINKNACFKLFQIRALILGVEISLVLEKKVF